MQEEPSNHRHVRSQWSLLSPQYQEFVDMCTKYNWDKLPVAGSRESIDSGLSSFIERGLGNGRAFTRAQLMRKFKAWKDGNTHTDVLVRQLEDSKIETTNELLTRIQSTDLWSHLANKIVIEPQTTAADVIQEGWCLEILDQLRTDVINTINELLRNTHGQKRNKRADAYTILQNNLLENCSNKIVTTLQEQRDIWRRDVMSSKQIERSLVLMKASIQLVTNTLVSFIATAIQRGGHGNSSLKDNVMD